MAPRNLCRIETRSDLSLSALTQMDYRDELRRLCADTRSYLAAWRDHPRLIASLYLLAVLRVFTFHADNNRFRKLAFLLVSALVGVLLIGQAGLGWTPNLALLAPIVAMWLVAFGVLLGIEVERIEIAGITLDIQHGNVQEDSTDD